MLMAKVSILYILAQKVTVITFSKMFIEVLLLIYLHLFAGCARINQGEGFFLQRDEKSYPWF
jgi:hypothetical protein